MITLSAALAGTAIVVGSNAPVPSSEPLRYAHGDARRFARALEDLGPFDTVQTLLEPTPGAVFEALDAALARPGPVLFYYSGHGDSDALFPGGQPLDIQALRERLEADPERLTIGILDTCRGGSWTQTKGLSTDPIPFAVGEPASVGQAFIASSSGLESAHELERLKGSVFTHHLVVGLRGAADRSGEGEVTLMEAYDYAKAGTTLDAYATYTLFSRFDTRVGFAIAL